jgi:hypothetical protein
MTNKHPERDDLRQAYGAPTPRPAREFWADFRRRAPAYARSPTPERSGGSPAPLIRWAAAAGTACAIAMVAYMGWPSRVAPSYNAVERLDITAPYESVMIMHDALGDGTIVWIDGL